MTITDVTRKLLWGNAHNVCAATGCRQALTQTAPAGSGHPHVILGQEAHIRGKSKGGPRFDPDYQDVDGYDNLILLCPTHHVEIDANDGAKFSVAYLLKLKSDHEARYRRREEASAAITSYMAKSYTTDEFTRFDQVDLLPRVDAIFVDVAVGALRGSGGESRIASIAAIAPGDVDAEQTKTHAVAGGAQALLHPSWSGGALLVGGPGQGKTTLLQYICQFHRARHLGKPGYEPALREVTEQIRFPFRVELRNYVKWAKANSHKSTKVGKKEKSRRRRSVSPVAATASSDWPTLEQYIATEVQTQSGMPFDIKDLVALVETEPVLFALDGLDEVAVTVDREEVSRQVVRTQASLEALGLDVVMLVATRPGAETSVLWSSAEFPQLHLLPLTQGLRLQYFQRWATAAGLTESARETLQGKLLSHQHELHVQELASTPMQLAILLHLLQRKGLLPQQRTELYREYIQTFLDREERNDKEPLLSEERTVVEQVHQFLAWRMQAAVDSGTSSGSLAGTVIQQLLREYLMDQPVDLEFAESLFASFQARVMCLVEREGAYEFDVQSLREYFAAVYLAATATTRGGAGKDDRLVALLARPYWNNVTRFFVGTWMPGEVKGLKYSFIEAGGNRDLEAHPMLRAMAYLLLEDRCLQGQPNAVVQEMVDHVLAGPGVFLAEDGLLDPASGPLRFSERAGRVQAVHHLKARLLVPDRPMTELRVVAKSLARHAVADDAVQNWWWENFTADRSWLQIAADLGCLDSVPASRRKDLAAALKVAVGEGCVGPILAGVQGDLDEAIGILQAELNAGIVDTADTHEASVVTRLIGAAQGKTSEAPKPQSRRKRRVRGELRDAWTSIHEASRALAEAGPDSNPAQWGKALTLVAGAWGSGGWVARDVIANLPENLDLDVLASLLADDHEEFAALLAHERERRAEAGNVAFWSARPEQRDCTSMDWLVSLITRGHTSTIIELRAQMDEVAQDLGPFELATAAASIDRRGRRSVLLLADELRLGRFPASVPFLLLLQRASQGATLEQVNKRIAGGAQVLRACDFVDAAPLVELMGSVPVDWFEQGRASCPDGVHAATKLTGLTQAKARSILADPGQWPPFVVHRAALVLRKKIDKMEPLAAVAARDGWFS